MGYYLHASIFFGIRLKSEYKDFDEEIQEMHAVSAPDSTGVAITTIGDHDMVDYYLCIEETLKRSDGASLLLEHSLLNHPHEETKWKRLLTDFIEKHKLVAAGKNPSPAWYVGASRY